MFIVSQVLDWALHARHAWALRRIVSKTENKVFTHMTPLERLALYSAAISMPEGATIVEVGSYLGASTVLLAAAARQRHGRVFCIDTWRNETMPEGARDTFAEFMRNVARHIDVIRPLRKRSDQLMPGELPDRLEFVFLDGDHSYEAVIREYRFFTSRLASGSILAMHDVLHFEGPQIVMGDAIATGNYRLAHFVENLAILRRT